MRKTARPLAEIRQEAERLAGLTSLRKIHLYRADYEALERAAGSRDKPTWLLRGSNGRLFIDTIEVVRAPQ